MRTSHLAALGLDTALVRRISVAADDIDPRTVVAVVAGRPVRPTSRRRVLAALDRLGLAHLVPRPAATPPLALASETNVR